MITIDKNWKSFQEKDPFNPSNIVSGYLNHAANQYYGSLYITKINNWNCEQLIRCTPKFHYPFDKDDNFHFPPIKKINIYEKLDGCVDENTTVKTDKGTKTIKEVCNNPELFKKVLCYDHSEQRPVFDKITGISIKENNEDDWYEVILENNMVIRLTGEHYVWLPELNCYRKVKDLDGTEKVLLKI